MLAAMAVNDEVDQTGLHIVQWGAGNEHPDFYPVSASGGIRHVAGFALPPPSIVPEWVAATAALAAAASGAPPAISPAASGAEMTATAAPSAVASSAAASTAAPAASGAEDDVAGAEQDGPVFCIDCGKWLNGRSQWLDHYLTGRKHRKMIMLLAAMNGDPDDPVHVRCCAWQEAAARDGF